MSCQNRSGSRSLWRWVWRPESARNRLVALAARNLLAQAAAVQRRVRAQLTDGDAADDLYHEAIELVGRTRVPRTASNRRKVRRQPVNPGAELTRQEEQIAQLARARCANPELGDELFLSARTMESQPRNIFTKLGISSRPRTGRGPHSPLPDLRCRELNTEEPLQLLANNSAGAVINRASTSATRIAPRSRRCSCRDFLRPRRFPLRCRFGAVSGHPHDRGVGRP